MTLPSLDLASARGFDPETLTPVSCPALEIDATSGGYAFLDVKGRVVIVGYDGSFGTFLLHDAAPTVDHVVRQWLAERRHANRSLALDALGVWQQAAVAAARARTTVADLGLSLGEDDVDYAEHVLVHLQRGRTDPMRTLAANDQLLEEPIEGRRYTHTCPLCGGVALHDDRYPRSVCDACYARTTDSTGRRITGANVGLSGGFLAHYAGTSDVCPEVTASKRCFVDGHECLIDEAHLGGVVVEAL